MKNLKFLLAALLIVGLGLFVASCSSDKDDPTPVVTLKVEPNALSFVTAGGTETLAVTTNAADWSHEVSAAATWLTATKSGNNLTVVATANAETTARTATITFKADGARTVTVNVTQAELAGPSLSVSPTALEFVAAGGDKTLTITTNVADWSHEVSAGADWLTASKTGATLKVTATANTSTTEARTATIKVNAVGATSVTVNVNQLKVGEEQPVYDQLEGNYNIVGIPHFLNTPDVPNWDANVLKVADINARLLEFYGEEWGYEPNEGSKYLEIRGWGAGIGADKLVFLEYTSDGEIAFPKIDLFVSGGDKPQLATQECVGLFTHPIHGPTIVFLTFENDRTLGILDAAAKTISLPPTLAVDFSNGETHVVDLTAGIIGNNAATGEWDGYIFTEGYQSIAMTRKGAATRGPSMYSSPIPARFHNPAKLPYRSLNAMYVNASDVVFNY